MIPKYRLGEWVRLKETNDFGPVIEQLYNCVVTSSGITYNSFLSKGILEDEIVCRVFWTDKETNDD